MQAYYVTLSRENPASALNDTHYYVIVDADNEETAKTLAMTRAKNDYPQDRIGLESCTDKKPKKHRAVKLAV